MPDAYAAAKGINALVMSLAAIPAYFLARRVLGTWLSLAAAALAVAIPSMVYTGTLMTENAFYPVFLAAVLALVVWLDRPTRGEHGDPRSALCLFAFLTRAQAIALVPGDPDRAAPRSRARGVPPLPAHVPLVAARRGCSSCSSRSRAAGPCSGSSAPTRSPARRTTRPAR